MGSPLTFDRLDGGAAQVVRLENARFGGAEARAPHRHDYHELIWIRAGRGHHSIDGTTVAVRPGTVTVIGRGQVHVFEQGEALDGAVVRFSEETLAEPGARRGTPEWLLAGRGGRTVVVPRGEHARLDGLIDALGAELQRPADEHSPEVQRHLLSAILLWIERWCSGLCSSAGRRSSAPSASISASSRPCSPCGTTTVRPPRPASSQAGVPRRAPGSTSVSSLKRTTAPSSASPSSKTWTCPRPITVTVPGRTGTVAPSIEWCPRPSRIQISSW